MIASVDRRWVPEPIGALSTVNRRRGHYGKDAKCKRHTAPIHKVGYGERDQHLQVSYGVESEKCETRFAFYAPD